MQYGESPWMHPARPSASGRKPPFKYSEVLTATDPFLPFVTSPNLALNHDYRSDSDSDKAQTFLSWLESETADALRSDYGNVEAVKSSVFLYVNRAYEAGLPDGLVGQISGRCVAKAGYTEKEQDSVFDLLESFAATAKAVHSAG